MRPDLSGRSSTRSTSTPCAKAQTPYHREYLFQIKARSFLHNQVRSIVGTLERVGAGSWSPTDVKAALEAKDRARCGPVCPAHGLYLAQVDYETDPFAT